MRKFVLAIAMVAGLASVAGATDRVERVLVVDRHGNVQRVEKVEVRRPVRRVERVRDRHGNIIERVVVDNGRREVVVRERVVRRAVRRPVFFFGF